MIHGAVPIALPEIPADRAELGPVVVRPGARADGVRAVLLEPAAAVTAARGRRLEPGDVDAGSGRD